jgi:putative ABC transport system ATP-binding protein
MIELKAVTKQYGRGESAFKALREVTIHIADGDTVSIIGKSGSGKSTLMHIMSGLDHPTTGTITVGDKDLHKMSQRTMDRFRATEMSFIFQSFFIEANQTCYQNVALPLEIAKVPRGKRRQLVLEALEAVDLSDKVQSLAGNLSGGQKQRLAIARAIVNKPQILFADEPTGNLDTDTGDKVMQLLFSLNKKLNCTLILVTHDNDLAKRCNTRISLKDGEVTSIETKKGEV